MLSPSAAWRSNVLACCLVAEAVLRRFAGTVGCGRADGQVRCGKRVGTGGLVLIRIVRTVRGVGDGRFGTS